MTIDDRTIDGAAWEDDRIIDGATWENDRTFALPSIGMTKTGVKIDPIVIGDDFRVKRTYTTLPAGVTINMAWFTVKKSEDQLDAQALINKPITGSLGSNGHITDADTTGGSIAMFFDALAAETVNAQPDTEYFYGIKVKETTGKIHHLEKGTIPFTRRVTQAVS